MSSAKESVLRMSGIWGKAMTDCNDVTMVPPILMAGIRSVGYKTKRSDRTLTGVTLEIEKLSQCGESTLRDLDHHACITEREVL